MYKNQFYLRGYPQDACIDPGVEEYPTHEKFCTPPIMCPVPKKMGLHEHIVRFSPCSDEAALPCICIKITRGTGNKTEPLVLGWAMAVPADNQAGQQALVAARVKYDNTEFQKDTSFPLDLRKRCRRCAIRGTDQPNRDPIQWKVLVVV